MSRFARARAVADAVLLEGYLLYPYRASAPKNQFRWPFGVLAPRTWSEAGGGEAWWLEAQCLIEGAEPALAGRLRLLQMCRRTVEARDPAGGSHPAPTLEVGGRLLVPWDEGELREVELGLTALAGGGELVVPFTLPAGVEREVVVGEAGPAGAVVRAREAVAGRIHVAIEPVAAARPLWRVVVRAENLTACPVEAGRDQALRRSCLSTHLLLAVAHGSFVPLLDPPPWAEAAAATCRSVRTHPVLAGAPGERDLVLAAPIILPDHPAVAPESPGDFFDATEIDELLVLRTATLTDEEKRQARATDPRAAALVDRVERLSPAAHARLHGAIRAPEPAPARYRPGARVRLRPGARRTDAQDFLFAGCTATVEEVRHDVDGRVFLAVTIDDDPAAELHRWYGRFHYYAADEVEPLGEGPA